MKKSILISLPILFGLTIIYLIGSILFDELYFENMFWYIFLLVILFFVSAFLLNIALKENDNCFKEQSEVNPIEAGVQELIKGMKKIVSNNYGDVKYYVLSFLVSLVSGIYFGFKFKTLGSYLMKLSKRDTQWETEYQIELLRSEYSFFTLQPNHYDIEGSCFLFNWGAFFIVIIIIMILATIFRETILIDYLKKRIIKKNYKN